MTKLTNDDSAAPEMVGKIVYVMQQPAGTGENGQIDLARVTRAILCRKWWIIACTSVCTLLAIAYALLATEWFRAETVLMPREAGGGSGLVNQLVQFGGLADLAGLGALGRGGVQEPMGVLRSVGFARRFIESHELVDVLAEGMNLTSGSMPKRADTREVVDRFIRSVLIVTEDKKNSLVRIGVEWTDASTAAVWANELAQQVNDEMRARAIDESGRNIEYLRNQLEKTDAVSLQQAISRLLETEMQKMMLAQGTNEYAFRVVDQAQPPVRRARPKRTLIVALSFLLALACSTFGAAVFRSREYSVASA